MSWSTMYPSSRKEWPILLVGDLGVLAFSLYATLLVRYTQFPSEDLFLQHLLPFSILSVVWVVVFVISGLYDKQTSLKRLQLPDIVFRAQVVNVIIAAVFFFAVPVFNIAPKTNLVIFLVLSSVALVAWRLVIFPLFGVSRKQKAVLLGSGSEVDELFEEINTNPRHTLEIVYRADLHHKNPNEIQQEVLKRITGEGVTTIIASLKDKELELMMPLLYNLSFVQKKVDILDSALVYEDVFQRVPLSLISHDWFVEHINTDRRIVYSVWKRGVDMLGAGILGLISALFYPFVWLAVKLDDGGPLLINQERIGLSQHTVEIQKFRTMTGTKSDSGKEALNSTKKVTRVGKFLRDSRIDELPQLWSVFKGDQSLIGPRPEMPALVEVYDEKVPYYNARHLVQPGLSGWAQIHHQAHPHHGTDIQETKMKLAYDLYYIKHRSIFLDLLIALRTVQILASRVGR